MSLAWLTALQRELWLPGTRLLLIQFIFNCFIFNTISLFNSHDLFLVSGLFFNFNCFISLLFFLILGLNYFIIKPRRSVQDAFLLGLVIYGVYETTNWALFSNWSVISVIIDTLWGGILFAITTYVTTRIF